MEETAEWRPGPPLPTVCRCCLAEGCYKDISTEYFWNGRTEVYSEMLSSTFDINISYSQSGGPNSNSRLICEACIARLRDATEFKKQVVECEKTFMQHLDPGRSTTVELEITPELGEKDVKLERVKEERGLDAYDDIADFADADDDLDDEDDLDDQPLTKLASKLPKKETVDILDLIDNKAATKRKATIKLKASPSKKSKTKEKAKPKEAAKASASKEVVKREKKKKDVDLQREWDAVNQNARIVLQHTTAFPFLITGESISCYLCHETFEDPSLFRSHMGSNHPTLGNSARLKVNKDAQIRVDVTNMECKGCSQSFVDLETVSRHLIDEHDANIDINQGLGLVPLRLEVGRFECIVCMKRFTGLNQLSRHTGTHFMRNICEVCGKYFETKSGMDNHIKRHQQSQYYCRYCKKTFECLDDKKKHVRESKFCLPFRCNICKERFLFWERREEHLVEVHGKVKKVYQCTECEASFQKRTLLYLHFKSSHTEDYKCQYCELTFSTRRDLRDHTFQHTGERPLKCIVCDRTFVRERSLRQHMITHDDSKKSSCTACGRIYSEKSKLKAHIRKHHPDLFVKQYCNKLDKPT